MPDDPTVDADIGREKNMRKFINHEKYLGPNAFETNTKLCNEIIKKPPSSSRTPCRVP